MKKECKTINFKDDVIIDRNFPSVIAMTITTNQTFDILCGCGKCFVNVTKTLFDIEEFTQLDGSRTYLSLNEYDLPCEKIKLRLTKHCAKCGPEEINLMYFYSKGNEPNE